MNDIILISYHFYNETMRNLFFMAILAMAAMANPAQAAPIPSTTYVYQFDGECWDCDAGTRPHSVGTLTLSSDYIPGTAISQDVFISYEMPSQYQIRNISAHRDNLPRGFRIEGILPDMGAWPPFARFVLIYDVDIGPGPVDYNSLIFETTIGSYWGASLYTRQGLDLSQTGRGYNGEWRLISQPSSVPEPTSIALLMGGLGAAFIARRRRV